jgi:hypothetical protein
VLPSRSQISFPLVPKLHLGMSLFAKLHFAPLPVKFNFKDNLVPRVYLGTRAEWRSRCFVDRSPLGKSRWVVNC